MTCQLQPCDVCDSKAALYAYLKGFSEGDVVSIRFRVEPISVFDSISGFIKEHIPYSFFKNQDGAHLFAGNLDGDPNLIHSWSPNHPPILSMLFDFDGTLHTRLPSWHYHEKANTAEVTICAYISGNPESQAETIWQRAHLKPTSHIPETPSSFRQVSIQPANYQKSVQGAVEAIENGTYKKIVLGSLVDYTKKEGQADIPLTLQKLANAFPNCTTFAASLDDNSTFIGATPERLFTLKNQMLTTEALGGSAKRGKTETEDSALIKQLLESKKDQEEHAHIVAGIQEVLHALGSSQITCKDQEVIQLPNIQHLKTPIACSIPNEVMTEAIVKALHPTPAVGIFPRSSPLSAIEAFEGFKRGPFTAPIGYMDTHGNASFFVGIRSGIIHGNMARLYAGCGIVASSSPEVEEHEVHAKLQALFKHLS